MSGLLAFQEAAVDRIVAQLTHASSTRRFLLADEVGLGKTLIAREVIERLRQCSPGMFTAVYVCSNQEIASQNRSKLAPPGADRGQARRLTLLCLDLFRDGTQPGKLNLYCFTPGTSLSLRSATGLKYERKLLLYLLDRMEVTPRGKRQVRWREFFRCGCGEQGWRREAGKDALWDAFWWADIPDEFIDGINAEWVEQTVPNSWRLGPLAGGGPLLTLLHDGIDGFDETNIAWRRCRNVIIGALRTGLAMATLRQLDPGVVILDEFQRFSSMLEMADDPGTIVGRLMGTGAGGKGTPALILSATPYKMLTLSFEGDGENHYQQFLKTLAFLHRTRPDSPRIEAFKGDFGTLGRLLRSSDAWETRTFDPLVRTRDHIVERLTRVASRTERNWYLEDVAKGVEEVRLEGEDDRIAAVPTVKELRSFLELRRFLLDQDMDDWKIVDFWKSCPRPLLFMDSRYSLIRRIRGTGRRRHKGVKARVPKKLVPAVNGAQDLARLEKENARFRLLNPRVFGDPDHKRKRACRFLWQKPTYFYYGDAFYRNEDPDKYLLFSHWRMVPKAVSALISQAAVARLPEGAARGNKQPLSFQSLSPLLALWASPGLAEIVDPLSLAGTGRRLRSSADLHRRAVERIREYIGAHPELNMRLSRRAKGTSNVVAAMLRVDIHSIHGSAVRDAVVEMYKHQKSGQVKLERFSDKLRQRLAEVIGLLDDRGPIVLTIEDVEELAHVAMYSPAIGALRASWSVLADRASTVRPALRLGLFGLRSFFHAEAARSIVFAHGRRAARRQTRGRSNYARHILAYCRDAHFQAVIDEYAWLVHGTAQCTDADGDKGLFPHLERAMGMWTGRPRLNRVDAHGHLRSGKAVIAQYALAFGDEVSLGETGGGRGAQRSAVRDAFNSPFWPFVLATTSVGQEGLDFHLYCRDIVHWNLPANPVDLEQREGRINRYNGLFIRQNVAEDYDLAECLQHLEPSRRCVPGSNLWDAVFRAVDARPQGLQRFKHGLFPNWIYLSRPKGAEADPQFSRPMIRRHLLFYAMSDDERHYERLKRLLATYRLAFGQPRQQDLLEDILRANPALDLDAISRRMRRYMVNLSPMDDRHIARWVQQHARRVRERDNVPALVDEIRSEVLQPHARELACVADEVEDLFRIALDPGESVDRRESALYALVYLANPYDNAFDFLEGIGFEDDVEVVQRMAAELYEE